MLIFTSFFLVVAVVGGDRVLEDANFHGGNVMHVDPSHFNDWSECSSACCSESALSHNKVADAWTYNGQTCACKVFAEVSSLDYKPGSTSARCQWAPPPAQPAPLPALPEPVFDIRDFGAVGDGTTKNTEALKAAVAAVAEAGHGTVLIPVGVWLSAPFNLTSHMTLYVDAGATLLASRNFEDYDIIAPMPSYGQGRDHAGPRRASFIGGQNLTDVTITGANGTIDGQGEVWWLRHRTPLKEKFTRGHLIELMWSSKISVSNVTLTNSPFWTLHPVYVNGFHANHVTIINPRQASVAPNTDGIDPDSTSNVLIENCYIETGDDAIAIKSGWDQYGYQYGVPSTNITIRNCNFATPSSAAVCIGSEMSGGVANITVQHSHFRDASTGLRLKSGKGRGGYIHDIRVEDVTMSNVNTAFYINDFYGGHPAGYNKSAIPDVRRLTLVNISGKNCAHVADLEGLEESPIGEVRFESVHFDGGDYKCSQVSGTFSDMRPTPCDSIVPDSTASVTLV